MTVNCNQTGKVSKVKVSLLSRSGDGHMTRTDLMGGSQLLLRMNKKEYPVTVVSVSALLKQALTEVQVNGKYYVRTQMHKCDMLRPHYYTSFTFSRDEEIERAKATSDSD